MKKYFLLVLVPFFILSCRETIIDKDRGFVYEYHNNTSYDIEVVTWHMSYGETTSTSHIILQGEKLTQDCTYDSKHYYDVNNNKKIGIPNSDSLIVKLDTVAISQTFTKDNSHNVSRLNLYNLSHYEITIVDELVSLCKYTFTDEDFENQTNHR